MCTSIPNLQFLFRPEIATKCDCLQGEGKLQACYFATGSELFQMDLEHALCAAQTALELRIFLSLLLHCWEYRHALLSLTIGFIVLFIGEIQDKTSEDKSYKKGPEIDMTRILFFMYLYIYLSCLSVLCKRIACWPVYQILLRFHMYFLHTQTLHEVWFCADFLFLRQGLTVQHQLAWNSLQFVLVWKSQRSTCLLLGNDGI